MEELKDKLTSEQKTRLEIEVQKVEDALKTNNADSIKSASENLSKVWNEIAQTLYQQPGAQGSSQSGPDFSAGSQQQSDSTKKDDKEVQDASYEVVDDK